MLSIAPCVTSDVQQFDAATVAVVRQNSAEKRLPLLRRALNLYQDDLLAGMYLPEPCLPEMDWLTHERTRLREACFDLFRRLVLDLETLGLREDARHMRREMAARFPDQPLPPEAVFVPVPSGSPVRLDRDLFVGRDEERKRLADWGSGKSGRGRLLTVTGPGGVGKTRLLSEALQGYWTAFVPMVDVRSESGFWEAIHRALQLPIVSEQSAQEQVTEALQAQNRCLLILDNLEQVAPSIAEPLQSLLVSCPGLRCAATSRRPLQIPQEERLALPPLPEAEAVQVFLNHARAVRPEFASSEAGMHSVRQIVRLLDGLPLALKLAASRAQVIGPGQMAELLQGISRLQIHDRESPDQRHRSLNVALKWSVDLLSAPARQAFATLSVFRGGFTLAGAQAVCGNPLETLDILEELSLHSLLLISFCDEETARYSMLSVVREFAEELLTAEEQTQARRRHADYFRDVAAGLTGLRKREVWRIVRHQITQELENFRVAIRTAQELGLADLLFDLMIHLVIPLFELGYWQDAWELMDAVGAAMHDDLKRKVRYLAFRGALYRRRGAENAAQEAWEEQRAICEALGDRVTLVDVVFDLAGQAVDLRQFDRARELIQQGTLDAQRENLKHKMVISHVLWTRFYVAQEQTKDAAFHAEQAMRQLEEWEAEGHPVPTWITYVAMNLPPAFRAVGQWDITLKILRRGLETAFNNAQSFLIARMLDEFALTLTDLGETENALWCYHIAHLIHSELRSRHRTNSEARYAAARKAAGNQPLPFPPDTSWQELLTVLYPRLMLS
ncbi:MAG: hypothetical protein OHK0029_15710 [Armatimonadaceae bacterium]